MHLSLMWGSLARCSVRSSAPNTRHIQAELQMVFLDSLREAYGFDITPLRQWNMRWCSQTHSHLSLLPSNSWQAVTSLIRQKCCMAHLKCGAIKSLINNCLYVCIILVVLQSNYLVFMAELFWWFEVVKPSFVQPRVFNPNGTVGLRINISMLLLTRW